MNYLTNYYRNLCEQLQEKLNILEAQINEYKYDPNKRMSDPLPPDFFRSDRKDPFKSTWKPKRTPEQKKAIDEWEAEYGIMSPNFGKPKPPGFKTPPRPYDPEYIEPDIRPYAKNQKSLIVSRSSTGTNITLPPTGTNITLPPPSNQKEEPKIKEKNIVPRYPTIRPYKNPPPKQFEADPFDPAGFRDPKINLQKSIPLRFLLSDKFAANRKKTPEVNQ